MPGFARKYFFLAVVVFSSFQWAHSQFAPAAGLQGSTAIPADSSCFAEWANSCMVQRGPVNIADKLLGYASAGADSDALGVPDGSVVSLGDGGIATLTFNYPIYNGDGFDFAVFENGFMTNDSNRAFLELGFVEVSSDGVNFFRFPSISNTEDTLQTAPFGSTDGGQLYDLAGKYKANYGTPFDLEELANTPGLDINNVTYVRIIDVVGAIDTQYASYDSKGSIINDPWPTPFASCGFDLDAVGIINAKTPSALSSIPEAHTTVYPNPVKQGNPVFLESSNQLNQIEVYDLNGKVLQQLNIESGRLNSLTTLNTAELVPGIYFVRIAGSDIQYNSKLIVE